jgi:hypothetical protein
LWQPVLHDIIPQLLTHCCRHPEAWQRSANAERSRDEGACGHSGHRAFAPAVSQRHHTTRRHPPTRSHLASAVCNGSGALTFQSQGPLPHSGSWICILCELPAILLLW